MLFRKRLFTALAILALAYVCYGVTVAQRVAVENYAENSAAEQANPENVSQTARDAGTTIGVGLGYTFFLCSGLPLFFLFALLAWRNGVGLTNERRHRETLDAMRGTE